MKRLALITTALLLSISLAGGITAGAAAAETVYPQNSDFVFSLSFSNLRDYAVTDGAFAFIDGNGVKVYEAENAVESDGKTIYKNGTLTEYGGFEVNLSSIDYKDGSFYYADGNGKVYSLPDKTEAEGITLTSPQSPLLYNGYTYVIRDNCIRIVNAEAENLEDLAVEIEGKFSHLKQYGNCVYAIKDNLLCKFTDDKMEVSEMQYVDFSPAKTVSVGTAQSAFENYTLAFVNVAEGSFMTEVDLSKPLAAYFDAGETSELKTQTFALLLGYSGNAAIISIGKKSYITLKSNVSEVGTGSEYFSKAEFTKAQILGDAVYASPYVMECVYALYPATGAIVTVTGKLHNDVLEDDFYEIEYTYEKDGQARKVKGYVIAGLLSGDNVNDNAEPTEVPDEKYTEKNDVRTVLLILMVVILVLIAISYISWVTLSDRFKKRKPKNADENK